MGTVNWSGSCDLSGPVTDQCTAV